MWHITGQPVTGVSFMLQNYACSRARLCSRCRKLHIRVLALCCIREVTNVCQPEAGELRKRGRPVEIRKWQKHARKRENAKPNFLEGAHPLSNNYACNCRQDYACNHEHYALSRSFSASAHHLHNSRPSTTRSFSGLTIEPH